MAVKIYGQYYHVLLSHSVPRHLLSSTFLHFILPSFFPRYSSYPSSFILSSWSSPSCLPPVPYAFQYSRLSIFNTLYIIGTISSLSPVIFGSLSSRSFPLLVSYYFPVFPSFFPSLADIALNLIVTYITLCYFFFCHFSLYFYSILFSNIYFFPSVSFYFFPLFHFPFSYSFLLLSFHASPALPSSSFPFFFSSSSSSHIVTRPPGKKWATE